MAQHSGRQRPIAVAIVSGQYHFVDESGWRLEWRTETAGEWWDKINWIKAGGYRQDANEPAWS